MTRIRRVAAYGNCRDAGGRVLLTRGSAASAFPGFWSLPGGGVEQGEDPDRAVVREFAEETGLRVAVVALRQAMSDVVRLPVSGVYEHTDRLIYEVRVVAGELRAEVDGTTDEVAWVGPDELAGLPLLPFTARLLGQPVPAPDAGGDADAGAEPDAEPGEVAVRPTQVQRFGAYGLVTDPAGRVLLARIAPDYPGADRWHLPGGGTDHGEQPEQGLARELAEETGQVGRVARLLGASHHHEPAAQGPERRSIDFHAIRVLFRVEVDLPTVPVVTEADGGSTAVAAWFDPAQTDELPLTSVARVALGLLTEETVQR